MSRPPRTPGVVYGVLAMLMVVLISLLALTSRPPPPPTIAEFAPQSVENITDASTDQSSRAGKGAADCVAGQACSGGEGAGVAVAAPAPVDVPRVRKCVGDPPRQIEDPQSPPCVPYWSGDNGGATYKGVTRDEIRIVAPNYDDTRQQALQAFFNKRFEFYGRRLNILKGQKKCDNANTVRADAVYADEQLKVFATTINDCLPSYFYYLELAGRGILTATSFPEYDEARLAANRPFLWTYHMPVDSQFANLGQWGCARLARRSAAYAGTGSVGQPRKFGIIMQIQNQDIPLDSGPLESELNRCGVGAAAKVRFSSLVSASEANNTVLRMKNAGVTTVYCLCHTIAAKSVGIMATQQGFFPEWIISTYFINDTNWWIRNTGLPPEQRAHAFGLTFQPRQLAVDKLPSRWAMVEGNAAYTDESSSTLVQLAFIEYRSLLLLASGIQMAGPNLTPQTFEAGLFKTRFPNPVHPNMAGNVGFPTRLHGMTLDAAEFWWSESGASPYADEQTGATCYIAGGARHSLGNWPAGDAPFFQGACDSV